MRAPRSSQVELQSRMFRLELLATAVAGKRIEVRATEGEGFMRGDGVLSLPSAFDVFDSAHRNEELYVLRTAFAATALRLGFVAPAQADAFTSRAYTFGVAPLVVRALRTDFDGYSRLWKEASGDILVRLAPEPRAPALHAFHDLLDLTFNSESESSPRLRTLLRELQRRANDSKSFARWLTQELLPRQATTLPYVPLLGWLSFASGDSLAVDEAATSSALARNASERKGRNRDAVRRVQLRPTDEENPFTHSFEKTETLEEYKGGSKKVDASDEMGAHGEALDALTLQEVVRSDQQTHSIYRADVLMDVDVAHIGDAPQGEVRSILYDEWDYSSKSYRKDFCTVRIAQGHGAPPALANAKRSQIRRTYRSLINELTRTLARQYCARGWVSGQLDGAEIDLDRMAARHAALRAGTSPPDRLYLSRTRPVTDLSLVVLIDTSLSSDSWVNNHRVLDVAVDALYLLAEVVEPFELDCFVAAFDSRTRRDCAFREIKTPRSSWSSMRERVSGLVPSGYTRIGPALRHAGTIFEKDRATRRLLLVFSDAKPSDYDRYEGRYGVADVQQAIRELRATGVVTHLFALDDGNSPSWTEMFGRGGYSVVPNVLGLAEGMTCALAASLR